MILYLPNERAQYHHNTIISDEIKNEWNRYIKSIYQDKTDTILQCDNDTKARLVEYEDNLTDRINNADVNNDYLRTLFGKSKKTLERLTLISAIANCAPAITLQHVQYAIECVEYFINNAQNARILLQPPQPKQTQNKPTKYEIIKSFFELFPAANQRQISIACGMSEDYISRMLQYKKNN